jgi:hypothetical protein
MIERLKVEEKVMREEITVIHINEPLCHKIIADLVQIKKLISCLEHNPDEDARGFIPEGDMGETFFTNTIHSYCSDVLAWLGDIMFDFRAIFSEMGNFMQVSEYVHSLDASGNLDAFDLKMNSICDNYRIDWMKMMTFRRQTWYRDDSTRCFNWTTQDVSPRCELEPDLVTDFFKGGQILRILLNIRVEISSPCLGCWG